MSILGGTIGLFTGASLMSAAEAIFWIAKVGVNGINVIEQLLIRMNGFSR